MIFIISSDLWCADIFSRPFSNGSPQCTVCHSINAAGYPGKTLGPDLSTIYTNMGSDPESLKTFIKSSGIEVMDAVYKDKNIPETELDNLVKAFAKVTSEKPIQYKANYLMYAFIVFVGFLLIYAVFFRKNKLLEENR
jgi:hypothetical protein